MNVAICFYGLLRTNNLVAAGLRDNLIHPLNGDVFVCCPKVFFAQRDKECQRAQDNPEIVWDQYLLNTFGKYIKSFNIIPYRPEIFKKAIHDKNLPETTTLLVNKGQDNQWEWIGDNWRSLSMFYQIRNVMNLCQKYERARNKKYSTIVLLRPDLIIKNKVNLDELDLDKVYSFGDHLAPVFGTDRKIGDHLLISKRDNMMKISCIYDSIPKLYQEGAPINNESLIGHFLIKHNIQFEYSNKIDHTLERGDVP